MKHYEVSTIEQAWNMVNEIFPTDYELNLTNTKNAGYPVYRSKLDEHFYDSICDLGNRIEVTVNGEITTIFLKQDDDEPTTMKAIANVIKAKIKGFVAENERREDEAGKEFFQKMLRKYELCDCKWLESLSSQVNDKDFNKFTVTSDKYLAHTKYIEMWGSRKVERIVEWEVTLYSDKSQTTGIYCNGIR